MGVSTVTDVVVQGGGMVGLTAAVGFARQGLSVTVLDRRESPAWQGGSYRLQVASLNRASESWLRELGAWGGLDDWRATPVRRVEAVDGHDGPSVAFDAAEIGASHLAHIVENEMLVAALARAAEAAGVQWRSGTTVSDWVADTDRLSLDLDDGGRLATRLIVGADGADSRVRELAGIAVTQRDYDESGVVTLVTGRCGHAGTAWQRFLPGGPLAFLPLGHDRAAVVWSRPEAEAERLLALDDETFAGELEAAAGGWLGGLTDVSQRARFPLRWLRAHRYCNERVALIGDAAHVIHPLAGQGANLGMADARALTESVVDGVARGRDPGDWLALRRYERTRRGANDRMQLAMDAFHWGFGLDRAGRRLVRRAGFGITRRSGPLRRLFTGYAVGTE